MSIPIRFRPQIEAVVDELVQGNFSELATDGRAGRVGEDGLRRAITEYGRRLVSVPSKEYDLAEARERKTQPGNWAVALDLWTAEEGRSDLTLSLSIIETGDAMQLEIDDLHVL